MQSFSLLQESELPPTHQREQAATPETAPPPAERRSLTPHKSDLEEVQIPSQSGTTTRPFQTTLSRFNDELRDRYGKFPLPHHSNPQCRKWIPYVSKAYIHPNIISKEEQKEQPDSQEAVLCGQQWRITEKASDNAVQLANILEARSSEKCECVLVEGGPGMGKSTLAWQVCHCWGRRELFDQYSTVLLLPLRDKRVQQAIQVEDLFFHLRDKKAQEEIKQDLDNGKETLLVLDGLDELPGHFLSEQSIFTDLLSGEVLGNATILVTSRPSATLQLLTCWKQRISKHFVICGFNEKDINEYAKSILSGEQLTDFQKHLSIHPLIQSIIYVPLHSAIVMAVYLKHKQLPKTVTELYKWLVRIILSQYLSDHPNYNGEENIHVLGIKLPKVVHNHVLGLSKYAFEKVCDQKLIFGDIPEQFHDLGFTESVPELFLPQSCSYNFLHLSIQEFLAAYHVSLQSPHEQEQLLLNSHEEHHLRNMMRFVTGLTKFEGIKKEAVKQIVEVNYEGAYHLVGYSLELLYECHNASILDKEDTYTVCLASSPVHHYFALGSIISNSMCTWKLTIELRYPHIEMFVEGFNDTNTQPNYKIASIDVEEYTCNNVLFTEKSRNFLARIHSLTVELQSDDNSELLIGLCHSLPICFQLETLSLPYLQSNHTQMVLRALVENKIPSLKTVDINCSQLVFSLRNMQMCVRMLQQNQSLSKMDISCCNINSYCIGFLAKALHNNTTLRELNINSSKALVEGAIAMADMLKHNTMLTVLNMRNCSIGYEGARAMANMLVLNTTLMELDIGWNSVGNRGTVPMAKVLQSNTSLTKLYMDRNLVGDEGAVAIAEMLKYNTALTVLYLSDVPDMSTWQGRAMSGNLMSPMGGAAIAEALKHNTTLIKLNIRGNIGIGLEGIQAMREMLDHNVTLDKQYLSEQFRDMDDIILI